MTRYVAFLRGINLGKRRIKMDHLAVLIEELDYANVATFIASGNVVFDSQAAEEDIAGEVESHLGDRLGYEVDTFVRSMADLKDIHRRELFPGVDTSGRGLHVMFLREAPTDASSDALRRLETPDDRFAVYEREVYWLRNGRLSDSPLSTADIGRALAGASSTMRNMNTVARIIAKFGDDA